MGFHKLSQTEAKNMSQESESIHLSDGQMKFFRNAILKDIENLIKSLISDGLEEDQTTKEFVELCVLYHLLNVNSKKTWILESALKNNFYDGILAIVENTDKIGLSPSEVLPFLPKLNLVLENETYERLVETVVKGYTKPSDSFVLGEIPYEFLPLIRKVGSRPLSWSVGIELSFFHSKRYEYDLSEKEILELLKILGKENPAAADIIIGALEGRKSHSFIIEVLQFFDSFTHLNEDMIVELRKTIGNTAFGIIKHKLHVK